MAASASDYFKKARRKFTTAIGTGGVSNGSVTTIPLTSTTNLDTDTGVIVVIDPGTAYEEVVAGAVSGSNLIGCIRGLETTTAQAHAEGAVVVMYFTESHWDGMVNGITVQHKQTGAHGAITADSIAVSGTITVAGIDISNMVPAGVITAFGGSAAPTGYLLCDGSSVLRSTYANLFTAIGTTYGSVDGTHFTLPDLRGRVAVGKNSATFTTLGGTGGEETHVLSIAEMPSHAHNVYDPGHVHSIPMASTTSTSAGGDIRGVGVASNQNANNNANGNGTGIGIYAAGGGGSHNNIQPYLTINYIIKT